MTMQYGNKHCAHCDQAATHKFTRVREGKVYDIYLCAEHAAQSSPYQKPAQATQLSEILKHILKQELQEKEQQNAAGTGALDLRCGYCGLSFRDYKKNLILGCSECYSAFRPFLVLDLRRIHGATQHVGRKPGGGVQEPVQEREEMPTSLMEMESAISVSKLGQTPDSAPDPTPEQLNQQTRAEIENLKRLMHLAITQENFAKAGMCRDQIRELELKLEQRGCMPSE